MRKDRNKVNSNNQKEKRYIPAIAIKKIPPEKALDILRKAGYDITAEQSEEVMDFLYIIVKLTLKEFFTSD